MSSERNSIKQAYDLVSINTDHPTGDAFGRLRTSDPKTIFDNKLLYGASNSTYWSEELNGSATAVHDPTESCVDMNVSSNGDFAIRQTRQRVNYQSGKSQLFYMTGIIGYGSGITSRIGAFHGGTSTPFSVLDGVCFEAENGVMSVCIYKGGVLTDKASQGNWNKDNLNGKGVSDITIDWTKAQIFIIDYEWLGVGRVRYGVNVDGITVYLHEFYNANAVSNVYMRSGNQPVRYEIRSTGGAGAMKHICCSVQSEGGFDPQGLQANIGAGITAITIGTTWELIYAIRLKSDQLDASVIVQDLSVITASNVNYQVGLFWNPVINGAAVWVDVQGAALQELIGSGSNTITPIIRMYAQFTDRTVRTVAAGFDTSLQLGAQIDGTQDVIALAARTTSGTGDFYGCIQLKQLT
jgi:hypothetical protein